MANLTLMALGSSAPEILLSIIEILGNNFNAGKLGPGTILFDAFCVFCLPCTFFLNCSLVTFKLDAVTFENMKLLLTLLKINVF